MNDHHYVTDLTWPSHNSFWRDHPEYWMGDSEVSPYSRKDNIRLLNYMIPEVRLYYFDILEELCTNYDVDGLELDFQRFPKFFPASDLEQGTQVMTDFVRRIRTMLDRIGSQREKKLRLCIRVPETMARCEPAGLDVPAWDAEKLVDMINVSSFYIHTIELDIEAFQANTSHARIYGEMNYVTYQKTPKTRRYTTIEIYRASALNLFHRGVDGLSLFNYDYVPSKHRLAMTEGLKQITDIDFLRTASKDYAIYPGFGTFTAGNEKTFKIVIPDDTKTTKFDRAVMRIETKQNCDDLQINVSLNGTPLEPCQHEGTELFSPVTHNESYPTHERLKFFTVPLDLLVPAKTRSISRTPTATNDPQTSSQWNWPSIDRPPTVPGYGSIGNIYPCFICVSSVACPPCPNSTRSAFPWMIASTSSRPSESSSHADFSARSASYMNSVYSASTSGGSRSLLK